MEVIAEMDLVCAVPAAFANQVIKGFIDGVVKEGVWFFGIPAVNGGGTDDGGKK